MKTAIFFDLDGTLSDPEIGIVRCIRYALDRLNMDYPTDDDLTWCIGPPLQDSLDKIVGSELAPRALQLYRDRFADIGWKENSLYPDIKNVLRQLNDSGRPLYVATSKPLVFADRIVKHFALDKYFSGVFGAELDGTRSNKGELLRFALSEIGSTDQSVMVGDREHDILGARSNALRSVGVTYGFGSHQELKNAGADQIVDTPRMLLSALA